MKKGMKIGIGVIIAFMLLCVLVSMNVVAEEEEKDVMLSLTEMQVEVTGYMTGEDASEIRANIDSMGDSDGEVSSYEVSDFEDYMATELEKEDCDYLMDANKGEYTNVIVEFSNAKGSIDSTDKITIWAQTKVLFKDIDTSKKSHEIKMTTSDEEMGNDYEFTVLEGYKIDSVNGLDSETISNDDTKVEGDLTTNNLIIQISKAESDNDSPGFELFSVVLVIGFCIAVTGWNKRKRS